MKPPTILVLTPKYHRIYTQSRDLARTCDSHMTALAGILRTAEEMIPKTHLYHQYRVRRDEAIKAMRHCAKEHSIRTTIRVTATRIFFGKYGDLFLANGTSDPLRVSLVCRELRYLSFGEESGLQSKACAIVAYQRSLFRLDGKPRGAMK